MSKKACQLMGAVYISKTRLRNPIEAHQEEKGKIKEGKMKNIKNVVWVMALCMCMCMPMVMPHQMDSEDELKGKELIDKVCEKSPSKEVCTRILGADPRSENAGLEELAMISLKEARANASDIINHLKMLVINDSLGPDVQQGMSDCLETLGDSEEQLEDAIAALLVKALDDTQRWLQVALAAVDTCRNYLHGNDRLLMNKEQNFRLLCDISLSICKTLVSHEN